MIVSPQQRAVLDAMVIAQHAFVAPADDLSLFDMLHLMEVGAFSLGECNN